MVECCSQCRVVPCHRAAARRFDGVAPSFTPPVSVPTEPRESIEDGLVRFFFGPCLLLAQSPASEKDTEDRGAFPTLDLCYIKFLQFESTDHSNSNLYYLEICHRWNRLFVVSWELHTLTGLNDLSDLKPVELPELRYLVLRGHRPFFGRLLFGLLHQLYAIQCPWQRAMDNESPQVLCPSLSQAVLDFVQYKSRLVVDPPLPPGHNLHTLSLTCFTSLCVPLSAVHGVLVGNASTLRLLRALPLVSWPALTREIAHLLPILENLERLHVNITDRNRDYTTLHCLIESMPKSYQMLEMTDNRIFSDTCSNLIDFLAAARVKPKELTIHSTEHVEHVQGELWRKRINEKLEIPFRWIHVPCWSKNSFNIDFTWTH